MSSIRIPEISFKNKIRTFLIICLIILINFIGSSQNKINRCSILKQEQLLKSKNPEREQQNQEFKVQINNWTLENADYASRDLIMIPVVIHLLYENDSQNITDNQINSQIKSLNQDFSRTNTDTSKTPKDFLSVAGNANIQFVLATVDPNGNKTNGIIRKKTTIKTFSGDDDGVKFNSKGGDDSWPTTKYFNIWVCDLGEEILGYGEFPSSKATNTYGLVIHYNAFGTMGKVFAPYNKGRTATHEVGHCFNLYHIWGDEPDCTQDDEISDTPLQKGENSGCPVYPQTSLSGGRCNNTDSSSMFMNYMDYSNDECMNMFSKKQVARMLAVLNVGPYSKLKSSNVWSYPTSVGELPAINDLTQADISFSVYPNPSRGELYITFNLLNAKDINLIFYDMLGNKLHSQNFKNLENNLKISMPELLPGIYFIEIIFQGKRQLQKLVLNN